MTQKVRWATNHGQIADREYIIARVSEGVLYLMPDPKTGKFSAVELATGEVDDEPIEDDEPVNHAPVGGDVVSDLEVEPGQ